MEELHQTIEGAPGGEGSELLSFWDRGNLKKIFEAEDKIGVEVYKKIKDIEKNYNADREVIKFSLGLPKGKQEKFEALEADKDKKIHEALAPFHGRFLEKLWSALDYQIRERSKEIARASGKPAEVRPESAAMLGDFYKKVQGGLTPDVGDAKAGVPTVEDKIKLAEAMHSFGEILVAGRNFAPREIDRAASENEVQAIAELRKIKQSPPPALGVSRRGGFNPDLDLENMPPFSAVPTLKDYRDHLKKFEPKK